MSGMDLVEKIEAWLKEPEDEAKMEVMFSKEESDILHTIRRFKFLRNKNCEEAERQKTDLDVNAVFRIKEKEREISLLLKEQLMKQMNILLSAGNIDGWLEIMAWFSLLKGELPLWNKFWEFHVMERVCDIFKQELMAFSEHGMVVSVLAFRNVQELTDTYFKSIFLCRRIEYGVEPIDEIFDYIREKRLSPAFIKSIVKNSQINDKGKVMGRIESRCWN